MPSRSITSWFFGPAGLRPWCGLVLFTAAAAFLTDLLFFLSLFPAPLSRGVSGDVLVFLREGKLLLVVLLSTALVAWFEGRAPWQYGLSGPRTLPRVVGGALSGLGLFSLLVAGLMVTGHFAIGGSLLDGGDAVIYGLAYASGFIIVAIAEEMLFRGYLQATLARIIGFWPAAAILSAVFGLVHTSNPGEDVIGVVTTGLVGLVFALALRLTGSLWWSIGYHALWDWAQAFLYGAPVSGYLLQDRLFQCRILGDPRWSGGAAGPEGSLLAIPVLALAAIIVALAFGSRARYTLTNLTFPHTN